MGAASSGIINEENRNYDRWDRREWENGKTKGAWGKGRGGRLVEDGGADKHGRAMERNGEEWGGEVRQG